MNFEQPFWSLIKYWRIGRDLTRADLAHRVGCSVKTIEKIESGERRPSKSMASLLALHLGIPVEDRDNFVRLARGIDVSNRREETTPGLTDGSGMARLIGTMLKAAPVHVVPHSSHNLPSYTGPLIGRDSEVAVLSALLLQPSVRVLTITGPPGIGKTRLAAETAKLASVHMWDSALFVSLAEVSDPELIASSIADAVGVREVHGETLMERLTSYFQSRQVLSFLDTSLYEESVAQFVSHLISSAPSLKLMITSQVPLGVPGEYSFHVPPLVVPPSEAPLSLSDLLAIDSARLLFERAQEIEPKFTLTEDEAPVFAEICRMTGGIPQKIEQAAAMVKSAPLQTLLTEMAYAAQ